jgi:hypothetical protein
VQYVLPLVYDDSLSYYELLNKVVKQLNILIENNNLIPQFIKDQISDFISSGDLAEVVQNIVSNFMLNVKYPPQGISGAVGDGTKEDTQAIQACLDYASKNGGGCVFFPSGKYLTNSLNVPSNVSMVGLDRYTTKLVLQAGATSAMITLNGKNTVGNITLDGNSGVQVNENPVIVCNTSNLNLYNLIIDNMFTGIEYNGVNGHLHVNDIVFGDCVTKCVDIKGTSKVFFDSAIFTKLSALKGECVINVESNNGEYHFTSEAECLVCLVNKGENNRFYGNITNATKNYENYGTNCLFDVTGVSVDIVLTDTYKIGANKSAEIVTKDYNVKGENATITAENECNIVAKSTNVKSDDFVVNSENADISSNKVKISGNENGLDLTFGLEAKKIDNYFNAFDVRDIGGKVQHVLLKGDSDVVIDDKTKYLYSSDYGISADSDDNTDAFKAFFDDIVATRKVGYLIRGDYTCLNPVETICNINSETQNRLNTSFILIGNESRVTFPNSDGFSFKHYLPSHTSESDFYMRAFDISDLTVVGKVGNETTGLTIGDPSYRFDFTYQLGVLNHVQVASFQTCFKIDNTRHINFINCVARNSSNTIACRGLDIVSTVKSPFLSSGFTGDMKFTNCEFTTSKFETSRCINIGGSSSSSDIRATVRGLTFTGCTFYGRGGNGTANVGVINVQNTAGHAGDMFFSNCNFDQDKGGVWVRLVGKDADSLFCVLFSNCYFAQQKHCFSLTRCYAIAICNCHMTLCENAAVTTTAGVADVTVSGCNISFTDAGTNAALYFTSVNRVAVVGNVIKGTAGNIRFTGCSYFNVNGNAFGNDMKVTLSGSDNSNYDISGNTISGVAVNQFV